VSFFKSKKSKKPGGHHHHGAAVQTADELARRLELTVQQQQALDRENGADAADEDDYGNPIAVYPQPLSMGNNVASGAGGAGAEKNAEDSEWLDVEQEADIDLTKFGIKEMEINEDNESLNNADDEALANRKTWNINNTGQAQKTDAKTDESDALPAVGDAASAVDFSKDANEKSAGGEPSKEPSSKESAAAETTEAKPAAYVPPSMRNKQAGGGGASYSMRPGGKKPNIEDAEEFPSLDVASKLEEEQEKTKKKKPPPPSFHKAPSPSPASGGAWPSKRTPIPPPPTDRQKSPAAPPAVAEPAAASQAEPPPPAAAVAAQEEEKPSEPKQPAPNAYVPPHLRNRTK